MSPFPAPIVLTSITIYPVKSCRGIALERARVERRGIALDRRWMLVDREGRFLTQREEPRLALIDVAIDDATLTLAAAGGGSISLSAARDEGPELEVTIWRSSVIARVQERASAWASSFLGREVRLVAMPDGTRRAVNPAFARPGDVVSFADGYPLLVTSIASLDDLCARLESPVGMERFRPNVVIAGTPAWDEDRWAGLRIGSLAFRAPKPCDRCVITTIDPATAIAGKEPLRTLASFRRSERGVLFGLNLIPELAEGETAEIAIGDPVLPIAATDPGSTGHPA